MIKVQRKANMYQVGSTRGEARLGFWGGNGGLQRKVLIDNSPSVMFIIDIEIVLIILVVFIIAAKIVIMLIFATTLVNFVATRLYTIGGVASRQVDMYEPEEDIWTDGSYPSLR